MSVHTTVNPDVTNDLSEAEVARALTVARNVKRFRLAAVVVVSAAAGYFIHELVNRTDVDIDIDRNDSTPSTD